MRVLVGRREFCGSLLGLACFAQQSPPNEWPQFRGNPRLTGISSTTLPKELKLLWTFEAGDVIESSAAISGGVAYVGCGSGDLIAVDLSMGKQRWRYKAGATEGIGESSPAVAGGAVYIGDLAGVFHAVDARTGKGIWKYQTGSEIKSSPVVAGERVLIGSYDGSLYCLSAKDAKLLWMVTTDN